MKEKKIEITDYFLSKEKFFVKKTSVAGVLETVPKPKTIKNYYASSKYLSHNKEKTLFAQFYFFFKRISLKSKIRIITSFKKNVISLLDYGAGDGFFVYSLRQKKIDAVGYDPFFKYNEKGMYNDSNFFKKNNLNTFDVITMWHSLEHTQSYSKVLENAKSMLSDEGVLIVACPNYKSFDSRYYEKYWAGYDVPRHLWHFSPSGMKAVFSSLGFELLKTKSMFWDPFYVSMISEKYKMSKFWFVKGFFVGLASCLVSIFNKNPSSVIYVAKKRQ